MKIPQLLVSLLFATLLGSFALAQSDVVVAKIGGVNITKSHFDLQWGLFVRSTLRQQGQQFSPEAEASFADQKQGFLERLARDQAIINASKSAGLSAKEEAIAEAVEEAKGQFENEEALNTALKEAGIASLEVYRTLVTEAITYNNYIEYITSKVKISDSAVRVLYLLNKRQFATPQTFCSAHILVKTSQEAVEVIAQLGKGEKFAEIAKKVSLDPGSKEQGGELGCEPRGTFVPAFEASMSALKVGDYTRRPVQTEFGFHVILLSKIEPSGFRPFESVKEALSEQIKNQALERIINQISDRTTIELFPANLEAK